MAWGLEESNRRSPSVEFDPERFSKLGLEMRKRKYDKMASDAMNAAANNPDESYASAQKLRDMATAYASYDPQKSQEWISAAEQIMNTVKNRQQSGELAKGQQELRGKEIDVDLAKIQADKEKEANKPAPKLTPDDWKSAMSAWKSGSYGEWWNGVTKNGTQYPELPKPNLPADRIESSLQAGSKGDLVSASTIANDIKQSGLETQIKDANVAPAVLGETKAKKEQAYITTPVESPSGKQREPLIPAVQEKVDQAKADYDRRRLPLDNWMQQVAKLLSVLPSSGPATAFDAIAAIVDYNKIIDPTSVVREAEFNIAQDAVGYFERAKATFSQYFEGQTLTEEGVKKLRGFAIKNKKLIESYIDRLDAEAEGKARRIGGGAEFGDIGRFGATIEEEGE